MGVGVPSYIAVGLLVLGYVSARADNGTDADVCVGPWDSGRGPWAAALEDWALATTSEHSPRHGRVMNLPPAPGYYISDRVDRPPPPPPPVHTPGPPQHPSHPAATALGPQPYEEWSPPGSKILNRPGAGAPQKEKPFKPSPAYPAPPNQIPPSTHHNPNPHRGPGLAAPPPRPHPSVDRIDDPPRKQVTETDLYLLTAIEKLVYRVDLMEKRLRRLEENVHYLVAGADPKPEPCVSNFTRIATGCYHFSPEALDWKSANLACRKLRANLLELDSEDERRTMIATMLGDKRIRGMDVWTGGLNPGLLWIWSHSARPVLANSTTTHGLASGAVNNHTLTIVGEGRCLALVHDPALNNYVYRGQDCAFRHHYICEKGEDKTKLSNEIERVARGLTHTARRARLLLTTAADDRQ